MSEVEEFKPKRKRQRLTYTCNYCRKRKIKCDKAKPKCSNCQKFGRVCEYEMPYWVNTSVQQNNAVMTDVISENEHQNKTREELYDVINYWKSRAVNNGTNTSTPDFEKKNPELGEHADDIIDLYASYDSLTEKHSSEEDNKPLSTMSVYKADHYMMFFLCFKYITLQIASNSLTKKFEEAGWKSRHPDGATKWLTLLDQKDGDFDLKNSIKRVTNDRAQLFKTNILPFTTIENSDNVQTEALIKDIESILPGKLLLDVYLNFFFRNIWPIRPYVDEELFRQDIKRLITFEDENDPACLKAKVELSQRSDFATLATLLIILRYTSVSIQVVDDKDLSLSTLAFRQNLIPVSVIPLAQRCLSIYKLLKKSSFPIIQALLYLRVYYKDCPEDGDGLTLGQSQMLFGMIVQSAISIGLHRDPKHYAASTDVRVANAKRRIWYEIVSLDVQTGILSGTLSVVPSSKMTCVKLPVITLGDPLERAQLDELEKEVELQAIHEELVERINRMDEAPTLQKLVELLDNARTYVNENYSMSFMSSISNSEDNSQIYKAAMLRNYKIMEKNLLQICLEITVYHILYIQYEDNKRLDPRMFKHFFKKCLESTTIGFDISSAYLSGALKNYINPVQASFALFPIITTLTYRMVNTVSAALLRSFHAQELLACVFYSTDDCHLNIQAFNEFINSLCNICENHLNIYEQTIGAKYHLSLKVICSCKFSYASLKKHRFSVLNKIVSFLETNDDGKVTDIFWKGAKKQDIRTLFQLNTGMFEVYSQWMQLSKSYTAALKAQHRDHQPVCDVIVNINHSNHFTRLTETDLNEFVEILTGGYRYCSVSASTKNVEQEFSSGVSSASSDSYDSFYDILAQDPMFSAQMSNVLQRSRSNIIDKEMNPDMNDVVNELFQPTTDLLGQFDDLLHY